MKNEQSSSTLAGVRLDLAVAARFRALAGCDAIAIATNALRRRIDAGDLEVANQIAAMHILLDRLEKTCQDAKRGGR